MLKNEFRRNFFSMKTLIVIIVLVIIGIMNILHQYSQHKYFIDLYNKYVNVVNSDIKIEGLLLTMDEYNGKQIGIRFLLESEWIEIYVIILFLFMGIFISSKIEKMRENGQINFIISRINYKKYLKSMLIADSLYILSIVVTSILIILFMGIIITGKFSGYTTLATYDINFFTFLGIVIFQILVITSLAILINLISSIVNIWIHNKVVIQTLPFSVFTLVPMIISSTIGNIFISFGNLITLFVPFRQVKGLMDIIQDDSTFMDIIAMLLPLAFYTITFIILYKINVKKYTENCL